MHARVCVAYIHVYSVIHIVVFIETIRRTMLLRSQIKKRTLLDVAVKSKNHNTILFKSIRKIFSKPVWPPGFVIIIL